MKVVVKTDEYTIYQRRDERYAVKDASKAWVNGDAKVAILVQHDLIQAALPAAAPEEPEAAAAEETAVEEDEPAGEASEAEEAAAEGASEEAAGDEASAEEGEEAPKTE